MPFFNLSGAPTTPTTKLFNSECLQGTEMDKNDSDCYFGVENTPFIYYINCNKLLSNFK